MKRLITILVLAPSLLMAAALPVFWDGTNFYSKGGGDGSSTNTLPIVQTNSPGYQASLSNTLQQVVNRGNSATNDVFLAAGDGDNFGAGYGAGLGASGDNNFYGGVGAGQLASGDYNFYGGNGAGYGASGGNNFYGGVGAGELARGDVNFYGGIGAGQLASGDVNFYGGNVAGWNASTTNSTFLGSYAGRNATGNNWMFLDNYVDDPGAGYNPTNDSIVIDGNTANLYLGRPTGTVNLRGTVTGDAANLSGCPSGAVATNDANYLGAVTNIGIVEGTSNYYSQVGHVGTFGIKTNYSGSSTGGGADAASTNYFRNWANMTNTPAKYSAATNADYATYANIASNLTSAASNAFTLAGAKVSASTNADYATTANVASNLTSALSNQFALAGAKISSATNADYATTAKIASNLTSAASNDVVKFCITTNAAGQVTAAGTNTIRAAQTPGLVTNNQPSVAFGTATLPTIAGVTNLTLGGGSRTKWIDTLTNACAFSATLSTYFTMSNAAHCKVPLNVEQYDYGTCFDSTTANKGRFTPNKPGIYQFNFNGTDIIYSEYFLVLLYKNGAQISAASCGGYTTDLLPKNYMSFGAVQAYANGTTDYFELWAYSATGQRLYGDDTGGGLTKLTGCLIAGN